MSKSIIGTLCALMVLAGCAGGAANTGTKVATALSSTTAQSLVAGVENMSGPVGTVIAKVNAGLTAVQSDKAMVCAGMSWANALFQVASSSGLVPASDAATEGAAMVATNGLCNSTTTDVASAVAAVSQTYLNTTAALKAAGVPVTVPAPAAATPAS